MIVYYGLVMALSKYNIVEESRGSLIIGQFVRFSKHRWRLAPMASTERAMQRWEGEVLLMKSYLKDTALLITEEEVHLSEWK